MPRSTDFSVLLNPKIAMMNGTLTIGIKKLAVNIAKLNKLISFNINATNIPERPIKNYIMRADSNSFFNLYFNDLQKSYVNKTEEQLM